MKKIFKLKTYDFDEESDVYHISTDLDKNNFEKLLLELNTKHKKNEDLISSLSILKEIVKELEELGHNEVTNYNHEYLLADDCPTPNSTYWEQKRIRYEELK